MEYPQEAPFIRERVAAIKQWVKWGGYQQLLARKQPSTEGPVTIKRIEIANLASADKPVDVYLIGYDEWGTKILTTNTAAGTSSPEWTDQDLHEPRVLGLEGTIR